MYRSRIVGLDLLGTRSDQSIGLCYDDDARRTCSPQQKIDSSELMQCNGPGRGMVGQVGRPNMAGLIGRRIIPSNGNATGIPAGRLGSGRVG